MTLLIIQIKGGNKMYENTQGMYQNNLGLVKNYLKSGRVLGLGILNILTAVITVAFSIMYSSIVSNLTNELMSREGVDLSYSYAASGAVSAVMIVITVIGLVPIALYAAGYFIMYFKSRSSSDSSGPQAGVTILYVMSIIELVLSCIAAVFMVFIIFLMIAGGSVASNYYNNGSSVAFGVLAVIYAILFGILGFVMLFTSINKVRFYSSIRNTLTSPALSSKGAGPYGVMMVISAVFIGLYLLMFVFVLILFFVFGETFINGIPVTYSNSFGETYSYTSNMVFSSLIPVMIVAALALALALVSRILEAKLALGYKSYIENAAPVGGPQAPYQSAPYYSDPYNPYNNPYNDYGSGSQPPTYGGYGAPEQPQPSDSDPYSRFAPPPVNAAQDPAPCAEPVKAPFDNSADIADSDAVEAEPEEPLSLQRVCPSCGSEIPQDARFCTSCGARL